MYKTLTFACLLLVFTCTLSHAELSPRQIQALNAGLAKEASHPDAYNYSVNTIVSYRFSIQDEYGFEVAGGGENLPPKAKDEDYSRSSLEGCCNLFLSPWREGLSATVVWQRQNTATTKAETFHAKVLIPPYLGKGASVYLRFLPNDHVNVEIQEEGDDLDMCGESTSADDFYTVKGTPGKE